MRAIDWFWKLYNWRTTRAVRMRFALIDRAAIMKRFDLE